MGLSRIFRFVKKHRYRFSVIVICYDMQREIERTLQSLCSSYQLDMTPDDYEVIVVDNGSPMPLSEDQVSRYGTNFRLIRVDDALPAPGTAINQAVSQSYGEHVAVIIDGARMLTPGVLRGARDAFETSPDAVVATLGFHLGPEHQSVSSLRGYNQAIEDQLLERIDWLADGYRLFEIASVSGSARFGWSGPIAECNCIFLKRSRFDGLGGYDPAFKASGGGLSNHDFYKRACELGTPPLYYLLGEGCFHQIHGGVTTGGGVQQVQKFVQLQEEYRQLRGADFQGPTINPILRGEMPASAMWLQPQDEGEEALPAAASPMVFEHLARLGLHYQPPA